LNPACVGSPISLSILYNCAVSMDFISGPVVQADSEAYKTKPYVDGMKVFVNGEILEWTGASEEVKSPIQVEGENGSTEKVVLGKVAQMDTETAMKVLEAGVAAWNNGMGVWAQMTLEARCDALEALVKKLGEKKAEIVKVLMWEICKNTSDATKEFDRTMEYIDLSIKEAKEKLQSRTVSATGGVSARVRYAPVGVMLNLGPFNYPFNETYATLIPSLIMGNCVVMKVPTTGGLAHFLTMEAFATCLPKGTVGFVSGKGRTTMPPIMQSGKIDILAFIGSSKAADALIKQHPAPHRLKYALGLDAKNLAVVTEYADLDVAAKECVLGATSFNGQRCTAIKLMLVHKTVIDAFLPKFQAEMAKLKAGLPWDKVDLTPLPEANKSDYINGLVEDATSKGAKVLMGGEVRNSTLMTPAVLYPVSPDMKVWHEEQFGPAIPIGTYDKIDEIYEYYKTTTFGQQAAVFATKAEPIAPLLDFLELQVGRVNINTQCSRGPDVYPFSGRKSSAIGTLCIAEALRAFSVESVSAAKANATNDSILKAVVEGEVKRKTAEVVVEGEIEIKKVSGPEWEAEAGMEIALGA